MKINVELNYEQVDHVITKELQESYISTKKDNDQLLLRKESLLSYEKEDYKNNTKLIKGLKKVLKYYMTHDDYNQWIKENG